MRGALARSFDWAFRSRETGRIVVGQWPNALLVLLLLSWGLAWLLPAEGAWGRAAWVASRAFLVLWAGDELLRGVNPWRRFLGAAVLAYAAWTILR